MNILDNYAVIHNYDYEPVVAKRYEEADVKSVHLLSDIKQITVSETSPVTRDLITAHRIKDYRRKTFSLLLLPDIHLILDEFLGALPNIRDYKEFTKA